MRLCRAFAVFFLELAGVPVWDRFNNPVSVSVHPMLTPSDERVAQVRKVAQDAIATESIQDDKYALAMIIHILKGNE